MDFEARYECFVNICPLDHISFSWKTIGVILKSFFIERIFTRLFLIRRESPSIQSKIRTQILGNIASIEKFLVTIIIV